MYRINLQQEVTEKVPRGVQWKFTEKDCYMEVKT